MNSVLLDTSALLALLNDEHGSEVVEAAMLRPEPPALGSVNLAEVVAKLNEAGMPHESVRAALAELRLDVVGFEEEDAYRAGFLRDSTRALGLSLGDRTCLALAQRLGLPVLTADRRWAELDLGVKIELVR